MSESELLSQYGYNWEIMYTLLQWWLSVSIGLLAIARFFSKKLGLFLVVLLTLLYTSFSIYSIGGVGMFFQQNIGILQELSSLREDGSISLAGERLLMQMQGLWPVLAASSYVVCVAGGFLGSIAFFIYSYRRGRSSATRTQLESE